MFLSPGNSAISHIKASLSHLTSKGAEELSAFLNGQGPLSKDAIVVAFSNVPDQNGAVAEFIGGKLRGARTADERQEIAAATKQLIGTDKAPERGIMELANYWATDLSQDAAERGKLEDFKLWRIGEAVAQAANEKLPLRLSLMAIASGAIVDGEKQLKSFSDLIRQLRSRGAVVGRASIEGLTIISLPKYFAGRLGSENWTGLAIGFLETARVNGSIQKVLVTKDFSALQPLVKAADSAKNVELLQSLAILCDPDALTRLANFSSELAVATRQRFEEIFIDLNTRATSEDLKLSRKTNIRSGEGRALVNFVENVAGLPEWREWAKKMLAKVLVGSLYQVTSSSRYLVKNEDLLELYRVADRLLSHGNYERVLRDGRGAAPRLESLRKDLDTVNLTTLSPTSYPAIAAAMVTGSRDQPEKAAMRFLQIWRELDRSEGLLGLVSAGLEQERGARFRALRALYLAAVPSERSIILASISEANRQALTSINPVARLKYIWGRLRCILA